MVTSSIRSAISSRKGNQIDCSPEVLASAGPEEVQSYQISQKPLVKGCFGGANEV
jgi:hypothetical protein